MLIRAPALALLGVLLLGGLLPAGCGLPPNTAVGDWSRTASIAADRPSLAGPPHAAATRAMQEALATYFYALGILWDSAALPFRPTEFAALAAPAAAFEPAAGAAIQQLGANLRAASEDLPLQFLPRDNSGPRPLREDWRLVNLIAASDGAVQALLVALARAVQAEPLPGPPAAEIAATDPVLQQLQRETAEAEVAARTATAAARRDYARMLPEIGASHAALKAQGRLVTQRAMERQVFLADDRLRRAVAALPREAPRAAPAALAVVPRS
jgi:hypothetical protein